MSKYRKQLLDILEPLWRERMPDWWPGLHLPAFYANREATFSWVGSRSGDGISYSLTSIIPLSAPREFTGEIFMSDVQRQLEPKEFVYRWPKDLSSRKPGCYRMGFFISGKDKWWHLKGEVEESKRFWESRGLQALSRTRRKRHDGYAAS